MGSNVNQRSGSCSPDVKLQFELNRAMTGLDDENQLIVTCRISRRAGGTPWRAYQPGRRVSRAGWFALKIEYRFALKLQLCPTGLMEGTLGREPSGATSSPFPA